MAEDKERRAARQARWREANPNYHKEWREKNRESRRETEIKYREQHREELIERARERRKRYPEKARAATRKYAYGLSDEQVQAITDEQGGHCAICGKANHRALCLDHCHSTGKVRGLLCDRCNVGLARFGDSIENLQRAIDYLRHHAQAERPIIPNRERPVTAVPSPRAGEGLAE